MTLPTFYSDERVAPKLQSVLSRYHWDGSPVTIHRGTVEQIFDVIPSFTRHAFRTNGQENRFKDEIRREPLTLFEESVPVAVVSKTYSLIQHRDLLRAVCKALRLLQIDLRSKPSVLQLSEYAERMLWQCTIPDYDYEADTGDPIVLQICCLNSVDTTTVLDIALQWSRLVCGNGMMFGLSNSSIRRRHIRSLDPESIAESLKAQFNDVSAECTLFDSWKETRLADLHVTEWLNERLANDWGPYAAARVHSILCTGYDGEVISSPTAKPSQLQVDPTTRVPGAPNPARNVFDLAQALSWFAGTRRSIFEQLAYIRQIPDLVEHLSGPRRAMHHRASH